MADLAEQPTKTAQLKRAIGIAIASWRIEPVTITHGNLVLTMVILPDLAEITNGRIRYDRTGDWTSFTRAGFFTILTFALAIRLDGARRKRLREEGDPEI